MGSKLTLDIELCTWVLLNTLGHCAILSNSKSNLFQSMEYMQYMVNWMHRRGQRTFACKSKECLWQDWYIYNKFQVSCDLGKDVLPVNHV